MYAQIRKVVVPAAGLGTRFLPATKAVPKEMLPIVDTPTLQLIVEEAVAAGLQHVVVVNGRNKGAIEDHFDLAYELEDMLRRRGQAALAERMEAVARMASVVSVRQREPLGLGHAVLSARPAVGNEPFAVMLGDDLIDAEEPGIGQLVRVARATGKAVVALVEVPASETHRYGIAEGRAGSDGRFEVAGLVEKPKPGTAPSNLAVFGRYVLPPDIFDLLERTPPGAGGEIQLTDALDALARAGRLVGHVVEGVRYDAGDRLGYLKANVAYALKRPELREGLLAYLREVVSGR
jgi:UTP--glucose-1-phosphate uridylyltransferase